MSRKEFDIIELVKFCKINPQVEADVTALLSKLTPSEEDSLKFFIDTLSALAYETGCVQGRLAREIKSWVKAFEADKRNRRYNYH